MSASAVGAALPASDQASADDSAPAAVAAARRRFDRFPVRQPDEAHRAHLTHGWLLPRLLLLDGLWWGRWEYWIRCYEAGRLPEEPIPRLELFPTPHPATRRMLEASLDCIPRHGAWRTWGSWQYFDFLLGWLLFGLGHKGQAEPPAEPAGCSGASDRLHQVFCLDALLLWPHDYWGTLLADSSYGKAQGFYPTPHTICEFMTQILCDEGCDLRTETVCDPCVGSGRMLLHASNHSLRLYGCDLDGTLCKATLVNGYLLAPWLARPIPWLDGELAALERLPNCDDPEVQRQAAQFAAALSEQMVQAAPPHAQSYLQDSEPDPEQQAKFAPLLKRRRKKATVDPTQGRLF